MPLDTQPDMDRIRAQPPRPVMSKVVPLTVTEREALRNYGTMAATFNHFIEKRMPAMEKNNELSLENSIAACSMAKESRDETRGLSAQMKRLAIAVEQLREAIAPGGPVDKRAETRAKEASSDALEDFTAAARELTDAMEEKTNPGLQTGPHAPITLEQLELREARAKALVLEADKARLEAEKKARDDKDDAAAAANKKYLRGILAAIIVPVILAILSIAWGMVKAQAAHDAGYAEGRSATPTVVYAPPAPEPAPAPVPAAAAPVRAK